MAGIFATFCAGKFGKTLQCDTAADGAVLLFPRRRRHHLVSDCCRTPSCRRPRSWLRGRFRVKRRSGMTAARFDGERPALPAAPGSVEQFILFAAPGMIGDQRLEHATEPRGKPFGSDTLGRDASAFAYQKDFISETLGISELGIAAQANEPIAKFSFILTDDTAGRMVLVRQLDGSVGKSTPALGLVHLEVTDMAQPGEELAFRITRVG